MQSTDALEEDDMNHDHASFGCILEIPSFFPKENESASVLEQWSSCVWAEGR